MADDVRAPSWEVMVSSSAVCEAVTVAVYVPSLLSVTGPKVTSPDLVNVTVWPLTPLPLESVIVAVTVAVDVPSAGIDDGVTAVEEKRLGVRTLPVWG